MSARRWLVGVVLLCSSAKAIASVLPQPSLPAAPDWKIEGPYVSGNLAIYLVHGPDLAGDKKYLTLGEGLSDGNVIVHEEQEVNELSVENTSDEDLFAQAGEIVKGGKQDRTLGQDMILSAHSPPVFIAVNCVERGRWTQRGGESDSQFDASPNALASKALKKANYAHDQQQVWQSVGDTQQKLAASVPGLAGRPSASPSSLELTEEDGSVEKAAKDYETDLTGSARHGSDVVGFFFAINGSLNSGDVYAAPDLFARMYPKLLHAAAVEALADREPGGDGKRYGVPDPQAVAAMMHAVDLANAVSCGSRPQDVEQDINSQIRFRNPAGNTAIPPSEIESGNRAIIVERQTDQMELFVTRDVGTAAPYLHRAYLTK